MPISSEKSDTSDTLEHYRLPSQRFVIVIIWIALISIVGVCMWLARLHNDVTMQAAARDLEEVLAIEERLNRRLFTDIDNLMFAALVGVQQENDESIIAQSHFERVVENNPALQTLYVLDATGQVRWNPQSQVTLPADTITALYNNLSSLAPDDTIHVLTPSPSIDTSLIYVMRAIYDTSDQISGAAIAVLSAEMWSESLMSFFVDPDEYLGAIVDENGFILTTFSYQPSIIGKQFPTNITASQNTSSAQIISSISSDQPVLTQFRKIQDIPVYIRIEAIGVDGTLQFDNVISTVFLIGLLTSVGGAAILILYLYQYRILRLQTERLYQTNHSLKQEVKIRSQTETSLGESERRYRLVTELISDYAFLTRINEDGTGVREWLTDSFHTTSSVDQEKLGSVPSAEQNTHPDDRQKIQSDISRTIAGEETETEYRWRAGQGKYMWLRVKRRPIWNEEQNRVTQIIGAVSDITAEKEAELALRESEDRYRMVTELISDYAFTTTVHEDGTHTREWLTNSFYIDTGYTEEPEGFAPDQLINTHPDDLQVVKADIERTIAGEETVSEYRWRIEHTDNYIWIRVKRSPLWNEDKTQVIQIVGAVSDITAEKEAELALRDSEARYRKVSELISDYAFSINVDEDRTLHRNWLTPSYFRLMGFTEEDIDEGFSLKMVLHPDDEEAELANLEKVLQGETVTSEFRVWTKSEGYIWLQLLREPVWDDEQGRVVSYFGAARNITLEKTATQALQESEERYRIVNELISDYAFSARVTEDGEIVNEWMTESFYLMTGYDKDFLFNSDELPTIQTHPDDKPQLELDLQRSLQGEEVVSEYRWRIKSGHYIWTRVKRRPIWNADHTRVIRIIGAVSNITLEKEAEMALRDSEQRYRRVSNVLTDFAFEGYIHPDGAMQIEWTFGSIENIMVHTNHVIHIDQVGKNLHPDDVDPVHADMHRTLENMNTTTDYRVVADTGYRWVRANRVPIWDDEEQRVVRMLVTIKDITAEKEAEFALEESQQRYRELTELMSDYAFSLTFGEEITTNWIVGSVEQITGISPEDVISDPANLSKLVYPEDKPLLEHDQQLTLSGERTVTEYRIVHAKTREIRWLRVSRQPVWDDQHEHVVRILAGATDITSQKEAEVALRESEERYRLVSELITDYVFSVKLFEDFSTEIEWVAGAFDNVNGITFDDVFPISQNPLSNQTHPDDYARVLEDIWKSNYGETTISEYRVVNPIDGGIRWLRVSRRPMWDEEQERVVRILGAVSDVTVQKSTEAALRESEERYRQVTELISDYVYSLSVLPKNRLKMDWFAGSFAGITGTEIENFIVESPLDMIQGAHPDDYDDAADKIQRTLAGESTVSEYRITNAVDNQSRWLRVSRFPIVDEKTGRVIRILGAVTDATAQKVAESALRDSEERYRMLTNLMTDYAFSIRIEEDGRLYREWLIGNFENVTGYTIPTSGYVESPDKVPQYKENIDMIQPDVNHTLRGETTVAEYQIINQKDHQPRWIRTTRQPIWNKDRTRVIRYLGAVKDITLEKEAEFVSREADELRQALDREKGLHALRSRFVSMVTHEFRNPLAAILSSVSILDKYNHRLTIESRREKFERIYGQVRRMTNLLEDLLEMGELEHRALKFKPQRLNILDVINDLYAEYTDSIGSEHNLILESNYSNIHTYADVQILRQALGNIISNAIKYSPIGSDVVCDVVMQSEQIVINVIDHGVGIPEIDQKDLFEAFYRASNVSTQPGTGLGLLIARQSIELHRGTIDFTSKLNQGTTFTIVLPRVIGKEDDT